MLRGILRLDVYLSLYDQALVSLRLNLGNRPEQ